MVFTKFLYPILASNTEVDVVFPVLSSMLVLVFLLADSAHTVACLRGLFLVLLGFQLLAFFPTVIGFLAITGSLRLQRPCCFSIPDITMAFLLQSSCCFSAPAAGFSSFKAFLLLQCLAIDGAPTVTALLMLLVPYCCCHLCY
jgi:hypothetical protein